MYLLVRSSPILEYSSTALLVITLVGASTAFFAATCGLVQNDLKRIIAFSTISQLGYSLRISYFIAALALHCCTERNVGVFLVLWLFFFYILYYDYLFNQFIIDLDFNILMLCNLPLSISQIKDKLLHYHYITLPLLDPKEFVKPKIKIVLLILVLKVNLLLKLNILKSKEYIYGWIILTIKVM